MTNKIEDFETGEKENKKIIFVDLSTSENLKNKKKFKYLLNKVAESPLDELGVNLKNLYHEEAELNAFHPINEISGVENIKNKLWIPLKEAFPDLERRNIIVIGGSYRDKVFVSFVSYLTGTFVNEWLGVTPTKKNIYLRTCEAHQILSLIHI